jgi:hypothetical protein
MVLDAGETLMEENKNDKFTAILFFTSGICSTIEWGFGGLAIWSGVFAILSIITFIVIGAKL